jgi:hypothetical protein
MIIKITSITFHKRVLNLNLLYLFYLLKKEFDLSLSFILKKKIHSKLFNILKSPVQYKIARNQLTLQKYKVSLVLNLLSSYFKYNTLVQNKVIFSYLINFIKSFLITSSSSWRFQRIFRV